MKSLKILTHPLTIAGFSLGLLSLLTLLPEGTAGGNETIPGVPMMRLALALIAIVALAIGIVPALKRLPTTGSKGRGRLSCVEQLSLGPKHRIALVAVDDRELLLGLQADGLVVLKDVGSSAVHESSSTLLKETDDGSDGDAEYLDAVSRRSFQQLLAEQQNESREDEQTRAKSAG